jgi:DNA-binding PadR family transcriptional regulator
VAFMVLKEVLRCICEKGHMKVDEISRELSISSGLVEYAIEKLKADKYIILAMSPSESLCDHCLLKSSCNIKTLGIVKSYLLTEKGKKLLGF